MAIAFLDEKNSKMAEAVMTHAVVKLYPRHLRPSFTNLQAAEILMALGREDLAEELAMDAFEYYSSRVQTDTENGTQSDDVEKYILEQAAQLLANLGKPKYKKELGG